MFTSRSTIGVLTRLAVFSIFFLPLQLQAEIGCGGYLDKPLIPLTLKALQKSAQIKIDEANRVAPLPQFFDINAESKMVWPGVQAPLALQSLFAPHISFEPSPDPGTENPMAVNLLREGVSLPFHISMNWKGRPTSTTGYASLPGPMTASDNGFLVGKKYPIVIVHIHGGGTSTATGKNAMSIGQFFAKENVPVLGFNMMGHSRGPRITFTTFKQQIDWLMEMIDLTVAPETEIVISGHSWGAQFAAFMHRLSKDPKYRRITKYVSLSPPADMSLGKKDQRNFEFEEQHQRNFMRFAPLAAESDLDFMTNMVENGKMSAVGFVATMISQMDYSLSPLTMRELSELKPLLAVQGTADLLVYLGREKEHELIFGNLPKPSRFIKLGPGYKFQGKNDKEKPFVKTGHNVFDRYIDGTEIPQTYTEMANFIIGEGQQKQTIVMPEVSAGEKVIDEYIRQWANFFQFRELVENYVAYDIERSGSFQEMTDRKVAISKYKRAVEELKKKFTTEARANLEKAHKALNVSLGLHEQLTIERAQWELGRPELTETRAKELKEYVEKTNATEDKLRLTFDDRLSNQEYSQLWEKNRVALNQLGILELKDYEAKFFESQAIKGKPTDEQAAARTLLSQIHQQYTGITKSRESRFNSQRQQLIDLIPKPEGVADAREARRDLEMDRSAEYQNRLRTLLHKYPEVVAQVENENTEALRLKIAAIAAPEGITDLESAQKEFERVDALLRFRYVPEGNSEIGEIVSRLREIEVQREEDPVYRGQATKRNVLEKNLERFVKQISSYQDQWSEIWQSGEVTSKAIRLADKKFKRELKKFAEINSEKDKLVGRYLRDLKESGRLTEENILNRPPQILAVEQKFLKARADFFKARERRDRTKWNEIMTLHLQGPQDKIEALRKIAADLAPGVLGNLASEYRELNEFLEGVYQRDSLLFQEMERLQYAYLKEMKSLGFELPNDIFRVSIAELLDRPYEELVNDLNSNPAHLHAMNKMLRIWHDMVREMRTESQTKTIENRSSLEN